MHHTTAMLIELGAIILALGMLGRLAGRVGFSPIPLYLLAGLAFGHGGILPLQASEEFVANPRKGSPHSRGVAIDLTLIDAAGRELDMGTGFDEMRPISHHARTDIPVEAQQNRFTLMGIMSAAGWDFYKNEWWHYQLFQARDYPLVDQARLPKPLM